MADLDLPTTLTSIEDINTEILGDIHGLMFLIQLRLPEDTKAMLQGLLGICSQWDTVTAQMRALALELQALGYPTRPSLAVPPDVLAQVAKALAEAAAAAELLHAEESRAVAVDFIKVGDELNKK